MDEVKNFLQAQLDEIRENKLRFGLIVTCLIVVIIIAALDTEKTEEIKLDTPKQSETVERTKNLNVENPIKISVTSENVKSLIGANSDEVFIQDPFKNPAPIEKIEEPKFEEKILTPIEPIKPVIFEPPKIETPPEEKFILQGVAIGQESTALVTKIIGDKTETLFLKIGDKVKGKAVVEIGQDFVTLEGGEKIFVITN